MHCIGPGIVLMAPILDLNTGSGQDQDMYDFEVCGVCMEAVYICVRGAQCIDMEILISKNGNIDIDIDIDKRTFE